MTHHKISRKLYPPLLLALLICASCFDRRETITVDKDGNTTVRSEFSGRDDNFPSPLAQVLMEPDWTIIRNEVDSTVPGGPRREIVAEKVIPYGEPLPSNFSGESSADSSKQLFPTEIKMWSEGNRTFYEFKRTYLAQRYGDINVASGIFWDRDIENRVLENGIFNVSEGERNQYLDEYATDFGYLHWRFLWSSLGQMVRYGEIPVATKTEVEDRAFHYTESTVTPVRILGILGKKDDEIESALNALELELRLSYEQIFADVVGADNKELVKKLSETVDRVKLEHSVSEIFEGMDISITVNLPGTVIESNGLVDPEDAGSTGWILSGSNLRYSNIVLHALSVMEN